MKNVVLLILVAIVSVGATLYITQDDDTSDNSTADTTQSQTSNTTQETTTQQSSSKYANKGLDSFPEDALSDRSITELDLSGNNLDGALPSQIQQLSKLEVLDVSDNDMTGIPAEIGQLDNLRILNYANNDITGLPLELGNLQNLEVFDLSGNNPSSQDLDSIRQALPSTTQIIL